MAHGISPYTNGMSQDRDGTPGDDLPGSGLPAEAGPDDPSTRLWCPGCDEEVDVSPDSVGNLVRCPYCNTDFFASDNLSHQLVVDDTPDREVNRDLEIDAARVKLLSMRRMAIIRSGSWWTVGLATCCIGAVAFSFKAVGIAVADRHWGVWPTVCMTVVTSAVWFARHCYRQRRLVDAEIAKPTLPEPETPPDFSTLGNGQDRWKALEDVR
jgi:hypothetical protein